MIWVLVALLLAAGVAGSLVRGRMFLYRHDQKWRRERGARFGDEPLSLWWHDVYRASDYSPEGQRLVPVAFALDIVTLALFVVVCAFL
jgi:hypothetical protein